MAHCIAPDAARERLRAALDLIDSGLAILRETSSDNVGNAFRVEVTERLETQQRTIRGLSYRMFGELHDPPDGPDPTMVENLSLRDVLWARLRITPAEIRRRARVAARIRPRRSLTGPPIAPELPELASAVERGLVGEGHIREVCRAVDVLPAAVSATDRDEAERRLVSHATKQDPNFVAAVGLRIADALNPDGLFDDRARERRRGLILGKQQPDGMSRLSGWLNPEARAYAEAVQAAVRPGRHQPAEPAGDFLGRDERSSPQRLHDAIALGLKAGIASGELGQHRGTPVTVIVTTTLAELNRAAEAVNDSNVPMPAPARTGGGSSLPMRDLIRMASDGIPYLVVFEDHAQRPLYLGRGKRVASADQRLICYARDRGCTHPDCMEPGYHCEVHHAREWADGGPTNADNLFFACGPHHNLIGARQQRTTITRGRLAWSDGTGQPKVNRIHHPDELLHPPDHAESEESA
jgi:Domain of unknown function (DUF222)